MTLDEAIKHYEKAAEEKERLANTYESFKDYGNPKSSITSGHKKCLNYTGDYKQLAEWLKELKQLREQTSWVFIADRLPENDGCYKVIEKGGRIATYVFHKAGNSEEYWKRCAIAWSPESYKEESEEQA